MPPVPPLPLTPRQAPFDEQVVSAGQQYGCVMGQQNVSQSTSQLLVPPVPPLPLLPLHSPVDEHCWSGQQVGKPSGQQKSPQSTGQSLLPHELSVEHRLSGQQ